MISPVPHDMCFGDLVQQCRLQRQEHPPRKWPSQGTHGISNPNKLPGSAMPTEVVATTILTCLPARTFPQVFVSRPRIWYPTLPWTFSRVAYCFPTPSDVVPDSTCRENPTLSTAGFTICAQMKPKSKLYPLTKHSSHSRALPNKAWETPETQTPSSSY